MKKTRDVLTQVKFVLRVRPTLVHCPFARLVERAEEALEGILLGGTHLDARGISAEPAAGRGLDIEVHA